MAERRRVQEDDIMSEGSDDGYLIVNHHHHHHAVDTAAVADEGGGSRRGTAIIQGSDGAKRELYDRLSALDVANDADGNDEMVVVADRNNGSVGEQVATSFLSMLDHLMVLASSDDGDVMLQSEVMQMALQSLVFHCRNTRRNEERLPPPLLQIQVMPSAPNQSTRSNVLDVSLLPAPIELECQKHFHKLEIVGPLIFQQDQESEKAYYGTTLYGLPHGMGFMIYANKQKWVWGHWRKGRLHGLGGVIYEKDGHRCFGQFCKDQLQGKALYFTKDSKYFGNYHQHKKHGYGILQHDTKGITLEGNFRQGRFEGRGEYTSIQGVTTTKGDFVHWNCVQKDEW